MSRVHPDLEFVEEHAEDPGACGSAPGDLRAGIVAEEDVGLAAPDVDPHDQSVMGTNVEELGLSASGRVGRRTLIDEAGLDQLGHQGTHHPSTHLQSPRQVGAGDRLVIPDEVQENPAVDLSGRAAGCSLESLGVDLAHERAAGSGCTTLFFTMTNCVRQASRHLPAGRHQPHLKLQCGWFAGQLRRNILTNPRQIGSSTNDLRF